jgi:hypothetical protein
MSNLAIRQQLVEIARRDVGKVEVSRNRAPFIARYWPATSYPEGHANREPYCAAAVCYWVREWLAIPEVREALGMTWPRAEQWRCKSARAFDWLDWAQKQKLEVLSDRPTERLRVGDIMVFDMSHLAVVKDDDTSGVYTIEANTGATGSRDGDGCFEKVRQRHQARAFIRLIDP